jgi:hypothetical protein
MSDSNDVVAVASAFAPGPDTAPGLGRRLPCQAAPVPEHRQERARIVLRKRWAGVEPLLQEKRDSNPQPFGNGLHQLG